MICCLLLTIYRLAFGQPRQAELVDHLLDHNLTPDELRTVMAALMIDLSPVRYRPPTSGIVGGNGHI